MKNKTKLLAILLGFTSIIFANILFAQNIEEIKILLKNGKYINAEILINKTIEDNLNNPELLFYKGKYYLFNTQAFFYFIYLPTLKRWSTVDKKH